MMTKAHEDAEELQEPPGDPHGLSVDILEVTGTASNVNRARRQWRL